MVQWVEQLTIWSRDSNPNSTVLWSYSLSTRLQLLFEHTRNYYSLSTRLHLSYQLTGLEAKISCHARNSHFLRPEAFPTVCLIELCNINGKWVKAVSQYCLLRARQIEKALRKWQSTQPLWSKIASTWVRLVILFPSHFISDVLGFFANIEPRAEIGRGVLKPVF